MARRCPKCDSRSTTQVGRDGRYPLSSSFLIFGYLFALAYNESRRRLYACRDCDARFLRHTWMSFFALPFYWLLLLSIVALVALVLLMAIAAVFLD